MQAERYHRKKHPAMDQFDKVGWNFEIALLALAKCPRSCIGCISTRIG